MRSRCVPGPFSRVGRGLGTRLVLHALHNVPISRILLYMAMYVNVLVHVPCMQAAEHNMASSPRVTFEIPGESFHSYSDLEAKVKSYGKSRSIQLTRRDSRTLKARASKRAPKCVESIHLTCLFGGKKYKNKGSGGHTISEYLL